MYLLMSFFCIFHIVNTAPLERIMVDLTYVLDEHVQNHPMWKKFEMAVVLNESFGNAGWIRGEEMSSATHMGTHMDAPIHFSPGGLTIDHIPPSKFIAPAAVINITAKAALDPDAEVTVEDLDLWESTTGQSLDGTIVLVNSGWGKKWHDRAEFLGTADEDSTKLRFPGISGEAAQWLVDNRKINGFGMDTISFDRGSSTEFLAHNILLGNGLFGLENVANLDKIPIYGALLHVMPMKIGQASGAPTRVIATYPKVIFDL